MRIEGDQHFRALASQAHYARRIGDAVEMPSADASTVDRWNIVDVVRGDDRAPVVLRSPEGTRVQTIPALHLERHEAAFRGHQPAEGSPKVVRVHEIPTVDHADRAEDAATQEQPSLLENGKEGERARLALRSLTAALRVEPAASPVRRAALQVQIDRILAQLAA